MKPWSFLVPPLLFALVVIVAWHLVVTVFQLPPYLLPSPWQVAASFLEHGESLFRAALYTAAAALCGFLASSVVGIGIAILFSQSSLIRRGGYPYAIYLQTAPIVVIAPLLATWIGEGFGAIVVVVFIISLFPVITNATDGLLSVPRELQELFQLNHASRWQTLWMLQFPAALPRMMTGVKTSSAMVVLGATVGEYFVGSLGTTEFGLGHVIFQSIPLLQIDKLFATTILCTTLSVLIFYTVSVIGGLLIRWQDSP